MAQVLKETYRQKILSSAKEELLVHGYRDASMRRIAQNAEMTVGNLYRYFENKDQLIQAIVNPALQRLNELLLKATNQRISICELQPTLGITPNQLEDILDQMVLGLVLQYQEMPEEMKILLLHSDLSERIATWFAQILETLIKEWRPDLPQHEVGVGLFCRMLAASLFQGLQLGFKEVKQCQLTITEFEGILKQYFRCFLSMIYAQSHQTSEGVMQ